MTHRALLSMAMTVATLAFAQGKVARPAGAAKGEAVAHVVGASGDVKFSDVGKGTFAVAAGLPLLKTDTLKVPPTAFVLVQVLANKLVVRIDDDIELAVKDIAVLNARADAPALEKQVEKLLTRAEQGQMKERMAGWYAATVAATVPTVQGEKSFADDEGGTSKEASSAPGSAAGNRRGLPAEPPAPPASPPPPAPAASPAPVVAGEREVASNPAGGGAVRGFSHLTGTPAPMQPVAGATPKAAPAEELKRPPAPAAPPKAEQKAGNDKGKMDVEADEAPACLSPVLDDALASCLLQDEHNRALREVATLTLRFTFEGGEPLVRASRGAFVPACAVEWVKRKARPCDSGWQALEVRLK